MERKFPGLFGPGLLLKDQYMSRNALLGFHPCLGVEWGEGMPVLGQQNSETGMRIQPVEGARATSQLYRVEQGHNNFFFFLNEVNS